MSAEHAADPEAIQSEKDGESTMGVVNALGGEQERPELGAVEIAGGVVGVDLGAADILGGVRGDSTVDVREAVEAADDGQPPVDGGRRQAATLHGTE